jgi:NADPH-dependent curcumin reductase CurA
MSSTFEFRSLTPSAKSPPPIYNYPAIVSMKLTVQGFIILDYASRFAEGRAYLADLRSKGKIDYAYSITEGLENCVKALEEVFEGKNYGKA